MNRILTHTGLKKTIRLCTWLSEMQIVKAASEIESLVVLSGKVGVGLKNRPNYCRLLVLETRRRRDKLNARGANIKKRDQHVIC